MKRIPQVKLPYLQGVRGIDIDADVAHRRAKCRRCNLAIEPGEKRRSLNITHGWAEKRHGSGHGSTKLYFHEECFQKPDDERSCVSCGGWKNVGVHTKNGLCLPCIADPRLLCCDYCGDLHKRDQLSSAAERVDQHDKWRMGTFHDDGKPYEVCLSCETLVGVVTERSLKREENRERAIMGRMRQMQREIESWTNEL